MSNGTRLPSAKCSFGDQDRARKVLDGSLWAPRCCSSLTRVQGGMGSDTIVEGVGVDWSGSRCAHGSALGQPAGSALLRLRENLRSRAGTQCHTKRFRRRGPAALAVRVPARLTSASPTSPVSASGYWRGFGLSGIKRLIDHTLIADGQ